MNPDELRPCIIDDSGGWSTVSVETKLASPFVQVDEVLVRTPSQPERELSWMVVRRKSAVAVAPITEDGRFVMVEQERVAARRAFLEFPAGQIDDVANQREPAVILATLESEMREEVGYSLAPGANVTPMGYYFTSQGFCDEHIYLFAASPVVPAERGSNPNASESILGTRLVAPAELRKMVATGEVCDSLTLALFARLTAKGILL